MADESDEPSTPTRTPLYFGLVRSDAVCNRHGEMVRQGPPIIRRDRRVYAAREGVSLFACPECCLDLSADAGEPNADPTQVVTFLWERYLDDGWNRSLLDFFVDLGTGRLESRGGPSVVLASTSGGDAVNGTAVPAYLSGRVARLV